MARSLHRLETSLDPHCQGQAYADGPAQASQARELAVLAELDVGKDVDAAGNEVPDAQAVDDTDVKACLVGSEDAADEEAQGLETVLRGALCAENALLELGCVSEVGGELG